MQVEVFSDVVCPWCYIGKRRLERALADFPHADHVTVTYRSFQLDPDTPRDVRGTLAERLADKYGVTPAQAQAMNRRVTDVAAAAGLEFHLDRARPANTFDAHRLLHLAAGHGRQPQLVELLMRAYFVAGRDLGDRETLVSLATEAGLDAAAARAALVGDEFSGAVQSDLSLARSFGINAVPFFVLDRKYGISGAQDSGVLLQALEAAWAAANPLAMVAGGPGAPGDDCAGGACAV